MKRGSRRRFMTVAGRVRGCRGAAGDRDCADEPHAAKQHAGGHTPARRHREGQYRQGQLGVPPLVENGHLVPLTVTVDSPMTEADHVKAIHVFTDKNRFPK